MAPPRKKRIVRSHQTRWGDKIPYKVNVETRIGRIFHTRIVPDGLRASQPRLSSQHRRAWLALAADPWVVSTMTQGLQEGYCYPLSSETAVLCCLSQSLHPQGSDGLEGLPQTHGPYGSNGDGFPKALQSPTLVEGPSQHQEGADHGDILLFLQMQLEAGKSAVTLRGMLAGIQAVRIGEFAIRFVGILHIPRDE
ncbi:unnamed protein product [Boreogadus saida]